MNKKTRIVSRRSVVLTMALMSKYLFCKNEKGWFVFEFDLRKINWEENGKMKKKPKQRRLYRILQFREKTTTPFCKYQNQLCLSNSNIVEERPRYRNILSIFCLGNTFANITWMFYHQFQSVRCAHTIHYSFPLSHTFFQFLALASICSL